MFWKIFKYFAYIFWLVIFLLLFLSFSYMFLIEPSGIFILWPFWLTVLVGLILIFWLGIIEIINEFRVKKGKPPIKFFEGSELD